MEVLGANEVDDMDDANLVLGGCIDSLGIDQLAHRLAYHLSLSNKLNQRLNNPLNNQNE